MLPIVLVGAAIVGALALATRASNATPVDTSSWTHGGTSLVPGVRYRVSFPIHGQDNPDLYQRVLERAGWTDMRSFAAEIPNNWPADDRTPGRWRFEATYHGKERSLPNASTRVYVEG
jgi:hypothetical protein